MKRIRKIAMVMLFVIGLMTGSTGPVMAEDGYTIFPPQYISPSENESGRYSFAVSAQGLKVEDGSGNTIDIHGGGKAGMSGWILFQPVGGSTLTLVGTGSGAITLTTVGGKKYATQWEIAESRFFSLTNWYLLLRIQLKKSIGGLPQELYLELTEGARPGSGHIVISTELPTLVNQELAPAGVICSGTGVVVIH